mgnify:CR=1 FL=1
MIFLSISTAILLILSLYQASVSGKLSRENKDYEEKIKSLNQTIAESYEIIAGTREPDCRQVGHTLVCTIIKTQATTRWGNGDLYYCKLDKNGMRAWWNCDYLGIFNNFMYVRVAYCLKCNEIIPMHSSNISLLSEKETSASKEFHELVKDRDITL